MASRSSPLLFSIFFFHLSFHNYAGQTANVQGVYWFPGSEFPVSSINSTLFTHIFWAFADLNPTTYQLTISSSNQAQFSTFTRTVQQKNPNVKTLLSIGGGGANISDVFAAMASQASRRKSFIDSSISLARFNNFHGLDLDWQYPNTTEKFTNFGTLLTEWRAAVSAESRTSGNATLLLTAAVFRSSNYYSLNYPVPAISNSLDWVNAMTYDYYAPGWSQNFTGPPAALYSGASDQVNGDTGIKDWIQSGLSAKKIVLGLPFYGYAWRLVNANNHGFFDPANGAAISADGSIGYNQIRNFISQNVVTAVHNRSVVTDYTYSGTTWIGYDDTQSVSTKVTYAKNKGLLGYFAWHVGADSNWALSQTASRAWTLSQTAQESVSKGKPKWRLIIIILTTTTTAAFLIVCLLCYFRRRNLKEKAKESKFTGNNMAAAGDFNNNVPDLQIFSLANIEAATERFSIEYKLGQGGYGPVYKGILPNGQEIAVKKLSAASTQGFEEFKNEVTLTAKLQHVNLVKVLGFCIEQDEQMLIYEYMPNKSLDKYLFDPIKKYILDWRKRVHIIEGITQGLLYLQEYSRLTIIHRDLKASNILLDNGMKPKIADFGMAKIFSKDVDEANTDRIVGTYGYIPPEYVMQGLYSTKSDVYSFGVLLLQIISGKRTASSYGLNEDRSILEYAYELRNEGKAMEFMDPSLDDTDSSCKLMRCIQIALLCVQDNANDRPSMLEVFSMLKSENTAIGTPEKPVFFTRRKYDQADENKARTGQDVSSVNNVTISQVEGR